MDSDQPLADHFQISSDLVYYFPICPFVLGLVRLPSLGGGKGGGAGWIPAIAGYPRATVPQPGGLVKFQKPRSITVMNSE